MRNFAEIFSFKLNYCFDDVDNECKFKICFDLDKIRYFLVVLNINIVRIANFKIITSNTI